MTPGGFRFSGVRCGLKGRKNDLGLIVSDRPAVSAALVTQNLVRSACVDVTREHVLRRSLRAIVANSGNANCCTGPQGRTDAESMAQLTAQSIGCQPYEVAVASTGVIGQPLDMSKVQRGIREAGKRLGPASQPFMESILTTDLVEKSAGVRLGEGFILGIAKGSGMISPHMATMLAFILTDLEVRPHELENALRIANSRSFSCLTVDGDTSTNDMVIAMANGASESSPSEDALAAALTDVCISLAKQVARDGEGATKLIEVIVRGSENPHRIARTIAESPLVKTAMYGADPNWGRILAAAGRSGVPFDVNQAVLSVIADGDEVVLFRDGLPTHFDPKVVSAMLRNTEIVLLLELGPGDSATIYTCDLGYGYVRINAEYHT